MSISSSLQTALSGLTVSARAAGLVSSNVANAMTEGYGTRSLELGVRANGQDGSAVKVLAVLRDSDPVLTAQRRSAEAERESAASEAHVAKRLEDLIGTPDEAGSLSARLAEFEARLVSAASTPHSQARLGAAVDAADALARAFRDVSGGIQDERLKADSEIGRIVVTVNDSLARIADLNDRIRSVPDGSGDRAALVDAQTRLVDRIAPLVPVESRRDSAGALQLYSSGGAMLVDRTAAVLEFQPVAAMEPEMLHGASILSGLRIDGRDVPIDGPAAPLGGGRLGALFAVRDQWGPAAQERLDAVARDLAERFDASGIDPTLLPADAGLFTDAGARTDPAAELGLAARLEVNAAVRPEGGGQVWRLRDGLGAAAEGARGDATLLAAQVEALAAPRATASGGFSATARSMADLVSEHLSLAGLARQDAEAREVTASAVHAVLEEQELARGVDTDAEMQKLLQIEQMYAANARVVQAAEAMLDELMRMTG
jgi:flagellar hook-associated protein 1 FlgK